MMDAEELAAALGAKRSGRQWKCKCVAHDDNTPSMIIFDGRSSVQVRCMSGCEPAEIIAVLKARGLWSGADRQETPSDAEIMRKRVSHETQKRQREIERMRELARYIFDTAEPIEGTLAERYFESRDLFSVARMISDIRYQPRCPRENVRQPAVVIAMRHFTSNSIMAIQRIFLTGEAKKDGVPMMLGSTAGSAMKLQHLQDGQLHVCEGLETGLGIIAQDHGPVWALGSTSLIRSFPVLESVAELTIWADHDPVDPKTGKRPGEEAARVCRARWLDAGREADIYASRIEGFDEADVWSERLARL